MSVEKQDLSGVHLWLILMKTFRSFERFAVQSIRGTGMGMSDFQVLEALLFKGPLPVNTIGPLIPLTRGRLPALWTGWSVKDGCTAATTPTTAAPGSCT